MLCKKSWWYCSSFCGSNRGSKYSQHLNQIMQEKNHAEFYCLHCSSALSKLVFFQLSNHISFSFFVKKCRCNSAKTKDISSYYLLLLFFFLVTNRIDQINQIFRPFLLYQKIRTVFSLTMACKKRWGVFPDSYLWLASMIYWPKIIIVLEFQFSAYTSSFHLKHRFFQISFFLFEL